MDQEKSRSSLDMVWGEALAVEYFRAQVLGNSVCQSGSWTDYSDSEVCQKGINPSSFKRDLY